jgi:hypothetical protein
MYSRSNQWEQEATVSDSPQVSSATLQGQVTFFILLFFYLNLTYFYFIEYEHQVAQLFLINNIKFEIEKLSGFERPQKTNIIKELNADLLQI